VRGKWRTPPRAAMFLFQPCCCKHAAEDETAKAITNEEWEPVTGTLAEEAETDLKAPKPEPAAPAAVAALEAAAANEDAVKAKPSGQPEPRSSKATAAPKLDGGKPSPGGMMPGKREVACDVFTVELTRPSRDIPYGIVFDRADRRILEIIEVDSTNPNSVAAAYNKTVDPSRQLLPGRFVMAVNGHAGDAKRLDQIWNAQLRVRCEVCQPREFAIQLDKSVEGAKLGVDIDRSDKGISITVREIASGLIEDWNKAHPDLAVEQCDRIVAVNGRRGSANDMVAALKAASSKLELVIARPDWDVLGP